MLECSDVATDVAVAVADVTTVANVALLVLLPCDFKQGNHMDLTAAFATTSVADVADVADVFNITNISVTATGQPP